MFHPGGGGYFIPTAMPQAGPRTYLPSAALQGAQARPTPRWQTSLPRAQTGLTTGIMQSYSQSTALAAARARAPTAGPGGVRSASGMPTQMSRPITGAQQVMQQTRMTGNLEFLILILAYGRK